MGGCGVQTRGRRRRDHDAADGGADGCKTSSSVRRRRHRTTRTTTRMVTLAGILTLAGGVVMANGVDAGRRGSAGTRRGDEDARTTPLAGARHEVEFQAFVERFGKRYCSGGDAKAVCEASLRRQTVYYANMMRANAHNLDPTKKFQKTETKFADLTEREFETTTLTYRSKKSASAFLGVGETDGNASEGGDVDVDTSTAKVGVDEAAFQSKQTMSSSAAATSDSTGPLGVGGEYPAEFSWRTPPKGYGNVVGKVHDQDDVCASCWAFVTVDSIASRIAVINKGEDSPELSVKQLMACDGVDHGCATGNMYTAYEWIGTNRGISTRADYDAASPGSREDDPDAQCVASVPKKYNTPAMCDLAQIGGEEPLYRALYERGPVAVGINANQLQAYGSGVIMLDDCHPLGRGIEAINHAAMVVGWGETSDGVKYWELKNSYGPEWGEQGFFKIERGRIGEHGFGTCGLLFESVYPIVTEPSESPSADAPCVQGSVMKTAYYRNETLNPGQASAVGEEGQASSVGKNHHHSRLSSKRASRRAAMRARLGAPSDARRRFGGQSSGFVALGLSCGLLVVFARRNRRNENDTVQERSSLLVPSVNNA